ncbi:hypothetical protein [Pedobacter helvus]|uniref:Uncharacterized protein n=1 Tax=Pedobacter helvus TaxID=2563444 RepID=A0ABW9JD62_9SPHI|nr:hypothetical protein [Pedobacter ureilyticus]
MEITIALLEEAASLQVEPHSQLEAHFQEWRSFTPTDIVNGKTDKVDINSVWSIMQQIKGKLDYVQHREAAIEELAQVVLLADQAFQKAFENNSLTELLIFLSIYSTIIFRFNHTAKSDVGINYFVTRNKIEQEKITSLLTGAYDFVARYQVQLSLPPDTPYHEREAFERYKQGIKEKNIAKTYDLIHSIERGRGIMISSMIENLYRFIYSLDPAKFADLLELKKEPHNIISLLQWMDKPEFIGLSKFQFSSLWLPFEVLRQLSTSENKNEEHGEVEAGTLFINQLYKLSKDFYFQTLDYFTSDEIRNKSLGVHLSSLSKDNLKEVLDEHCKLNNNDKDKITKDKLLDAFDKNADEDKTLYLLSIVYDKWNLFMDSLMHKPDFYAADLVLTDYVNYVLHYQIATQSTIEIENQIAKIIENIVYINEKWFYSNSTRNNFFYLELSKLYILSFTAGYFIKQGNTVEIDNWQDLYSNKIIQSIFLKKDKIDILHKMDENFQGK